MPSSAIRLVPWLLLLACGLVVVLGWQNRSLRGERREWIERATQPQACWRRTAPRARITPEIA